MVSLDQGTLIYGIRSEKYPELHCYGIVITASCDIAQSKVSKIYYLTAINIIDWLCYEKTYLNMYKSKIESQRKNFYECAKKHELNASLLEQFTREEVILILESEVKNKKDREKFINNYDLFCQYCKKRYTVDDIKNAIHNDKTIVEKYIKGIDKGDYNHYYFLPNIAYREKGDKICGLIVDLQEINSLSFLDANNIVNPGIDAMILSDYGEDEQKRYKNSFWLENENDFVKIEGKVSSPWREHLMQRFSHCFARIGLDGATDSDYEKIVAQI